MARRIYNDQDKANVLVALTVNNGNIRRTGRDTGIPEATIRSWRDLWDREGVPAELEVLSENTALDTVEEMEVVRDLALADLKRQIQTGEVKPAQLIATVGVLEDKIRLGKGLATSRSESTHIQLEAPEEIRKQLTEYVMDVLAKSDERDQDIIDAEAVEITPKGLLRAV